MGAWKGHSIEAPPLEKERRPRISWVLAGPHACQLRTCTLFSWPQQRPRTNLRHKGVAIMLIYLIVLRVRIKVCSDTGSTSLRSVIYLHFFPFSLWGLSELSRYIFSY